MDYRQTLINMVDRFNVTAVEEFKEIELKIIADSKSIFKKNKDFDGHIEKLRKCKRAAQRIDPRSVGVSPADREMAELKEHLQRCIVIFNGLCDDYIQFQTALRAKSSGEEKIKYSEIRHINEKIRCAKANLNEQLIEVNVRYADFNELAREEEDEEALDGVEYMTYEALKRSDA